MSHPAGSNDMGRTELDLVRAEARYRRERRDLYAARLYSGRPASVSRLDELKREHDSAHARLVRVLEQQREKERRNEQAKPL